MKNKAFHRAYCAVLRDLAENQGRFRRVGDILAGLGLRTRTASLLLW